MDIIVCIKQVPGTTDVEIDQETGVLKRDGVKAKLNPYDLFALETAFRIKGESGGRVIAITMGPPAARASLLEAVYMGADEGVLMSDPRFAGADVVATSYTLSQGIRTLGAYGLVICGKQTTDGDTAQVGPEIAEFLGIPHCVNVTELPSFEGAGTDHPAVIVKTALETVVQTQKITLPCLLGMDRDIYTPRLPSYLRKKQIPDAPIRVLTLDDLPDRDALHYGLSGSPTQVERIYPPASDIRRHVVEGSATDLSGELIRVLEQFRLI